MYPIKTLTDSGMIPKPGFPDIIIYEHTKEDVARYWAGVLSLVSDLLASHSIVVTVLDVVFDWGINLIRQVHARLTHLNMLHTALSIGHQADSLSADAMSVVLQCDVIIDESYEQSTGGLTEMDNTSPDGFIQTHNIAPYASQIDAITAKNVYTLAGTTGVTVTNPSSPMKGYIGLDWFERGVSRADEVRLAGGVNRVGQVGLCMM
jgi:hypothetical protein